MAVRDILNTSRDVLRALARGLMQRSDPAENRRSRWPLSNNSSGVRVDHDTALTLGAFNACVRVVAETLGVLSWGLYQRGSDGGRRRRSDTLLDRLLSLQPNPEMTAQTFREVLTGHALCRGNGYAEIVFDGAGRVAEMWPLPVDTRPVRSADGSLWYEGHVGSEKFALESWRVFHLKGLGYDGLSGWDTISYMAQSIGYGIAVEDFSSDYFRNGAAFSAVLKHPKTISDEAYQRLQTSFNAANVGTGNRWRVKILEEAMDLQTVSATAEQAQLIEARKISPLDIARWFRVPPHKIGLLEHVTMNNIEHMGIEFVVDTILSWATKWEQEANVKLLGVKYARDHYTKLNLNTLARGDMKSRYEAYRIGREGGWLSPNMILELEEMNPMTDEEGGNLFLVPLNYRDSRQVVLETERMLEDPSLLDPKPETPPGDGALADPKSGKAATMAKRLELIKREIA